MINLKKLHPQYVTNETGERISVILSISDFQELMEDIEDLAAVAERRKEPTISHEQLVSELKKKWPPIRSSGNSQRRKSCVS